MGNPKKGKSGYIPACNNEWKPGVCQKGKIKCTDCGHKDYLALNEEVIYNHLMGRGNLTAGVYPMCLDETCNFLAIDFDDGEWQKDLNYLKRLAAFKNPEYYKAQALR
ncbi:MAG: hypothetical protein WA125_12770 [Desulfosporosinus sp.]